MAEDSKTAQGEAVSAAATEQKATEAKTIAEDPEIPEQVRAWLEKRIQSSEDKVRTKYVKELKAKEAEIEEVRKEKMTAEERARYEQQKAKEAFDTERRQFELAKLELYASKALSEEGYGLDVLPFVLSDSEEAVAQKIKALKAFIASREKVVSERILRTEGRSVQQTFPGAQGALSIDQLRRMSQAQMDDLLSTPEGRSRAESAFRGGR